MATAQTIEALGRVTNSARGLAEMLHLGKWRRSWEHCSDTRRRFCSQVSFFRKSFIVRFHSVSCSDARGEFAFRPWMFRELVGWRHDDTTVCCSHVRWDVTVCISVKSVFDRSVGARKRINSILLKAKFGAFRVRADIRQPRVTFPQ